jgi:hypothetical protein
VEVLEEEDLAQDLVVQVVLVVEQEDPQLVLQVEQATLHQQVHLKEIMVVLQLHQVFLLLVVEVL